MKFTNVLCIQQKESSGDGKTLMTFVSFDPTI
jgi:hypothetical protein